MVFENLDSTELNCVAVNWDIAKASLPTINGIDICTGPRSGKDDMAEFTCAGEATCDDTTLAADADHNNIGNQDLQLDISQEPTAITLRSVSASGNDINLKIGFVGVAAIGPVTGPILVFRGRELNEA